ncbi:MAG TPA: hypothetical protein VJL08_01805 [Dehalococcoidia bacterium]|nr:hypothetical protein [Dehalococcoidia bacterium]
MVRDKVPRDGSGPDERKNAVEPGGGGWGCPHEVGDICHLDRQTCKPGRVGCILFRHMKPRKD